MNESSAGLSEEQRTLLARALDDAQAYRGFPEVDCADCEASDDVLCDDHHADQDLRDAYRGLGEQLGLDPEPESAEPEPWNRAGAPDHLYGAPECSEADPETAHFGWPSAAEPADRGQAPVQVPREAWERGPDAYRHQTRPGPERERAGQVLGPDQVARAEQAYAGEQRDPWAQRGRAPVAAALPDGTPHADPYLADRGWTARHGVYVRQPATEADPGHRAELVARQAATATMACAHAVLAAAAATGLSAHLDPLDTDAWRDVAATPCTVPGPPGHHWQLSGGQPKDLRLSWQQDPAARARLEEELFGKHVLITDHDDWPVAEVVAGYRSQPEAEFSFRQMKDTHVVSFSPMFHWTEHNIRVHTFTCVLALQVARLMRLKARRAGLNLSVRALLAELAGIGETVLLYQRERGRPKARRMLTEQGRQQQQLHEIFGLSRYAPPS